MAWSATTTSASWTASRRASSPTIRSGIDPSGSPVPGTRKAMSRRSDGRDFTAMMRIPRDDSWRAISRPIDPYPTMTAVVPRTTEMSGASSGQAWAAWSAGPGRWLVDAQDHPADVFGDRDGIDAPGIGDQDALPPRRIVGEMVDPGRPELEPAQARHLRQVGRHARPDDDLDLLVGQRQRVERRIAADVDHIEVGRERSQALDRRGLDLGVKDQPHAPNDSAGRSRRRSIAGHGPRPDRPRPDRAGRPRVHPAARAHADRAVAHPEPLGLLAADPGRAGHPRRAGTVPGGRRRRPCRPDAARRRARPGLAAAPRRGQRPAPRHGLRLVPDGLLPAGSAHRSALGGRPGRRAGPRGRGREWGTRGSGPGSSARSARTSRGSRRPRSASIGRRPGRRAGPGWPSRPMASCRTSGSPSSGSSRRRAPIPRAWSSATPTPTRSSITSSRSSSAAPASSSISSACPGPGNARPRRARSSSSASCCRAAMPSGSCSARTSATTISSRVNGGNGYTYLAATFLPRLREAGVSDAEVETMTVANPRRLLTIG